MPRRCALRDDGTVQLTDYVKPVVTITYCTQCRWLLRAAWLAQELLSTFEGDLHEVALRPGTGGVFIIACDGKTIWDRVADGGFPDARELKRRVRDRIAPGRELGHIDRPSNHSSD